MSFEDDGTADACEVALTTVEESGRLQAFGGSHSDQWNENLAHQVADGLWISHSDAEIRDRQLTSAFAALVGIAPKDELEGMMAAQLIAAHNASME